MQSNLFRYILLFLLLIFPLGAADLIIDPTQYPDNNQPYLLQKLLIRIETQPFNIIAFLIFACAVIHIFLSNKIHRLSESLRDGKTDSELTPWRLFLIHIVKFCGEVEVVFGLWTIPLLISMVVFFSWDTMLHYLDDLSYTEPIFVIVIMIIAATSPIVAFTTNILKRLMAVFGDSIKMQWMLLLTVGPLLGSFITEPGAMTLTAMLLARQFYIYHPGARLAYATLGLLFVNVSVGGVLTHFAAPPVLLVASTWGWGTWFMFTHFGIKAIIGILLANASYLFFFRDDFARLERRIKTSQKKVEIIQEKPLPFWITLGHLFFLILVVVLNHYPVLFIGAFLFFLGFYQATLRHQAPLKIKEGILIGFFLAGLVVHGTLQGWWIAPLLQGAHEGTVLLLATALSAFVDNAAVTYLTTLVPNFADNLKYAVVAGAVTGGGLTVMANAPNPVGHSLLEKHFSHGIAPAKLALAAAWPTVIMLLIFYFF